MNKIKISIAQMNITLGEPEVNLSRALDWINAAAAQDSSAILLPELWTSGYDLPHAERYAQQNLEILRQLQSVSDELKISIGGSCLLSHAHKIRNTMKWISPNLTNVPPYSKIHLFQKMEESTWLEAGDQLTSFQESWANCALAICYDLRFPEIFRLYALRGAQVIWLCAEWPTKRISHWNILSQARAIENQLFFVAANSVGKTGTQDIFGGCSKIISPWGEILAEGSQTAEELLTAEINLDDIAKARDRISALADRRSDIYILDKLP
jgi:omega-amidase